jgi:hypothetical protein
MPFFPIIRKNPLVMRSVSVISAAAVIVVTTISGTGCFSGRVYLPVEEIDRPLSLPPASGTIGIRWDAWVRSDDYSKKNSVVSPVFLPPYFKLGNRSECYIPGVFRYYLLKNTEIKNNTVRITGTNAALTAGLYNISYSNSEGFGARFSAGIDYKRPLFEKIWVCADGALTYTTDNNVYGGWAEAGIGYQISRCFYAMFIPGYSIYNPNVNDGQLVSFPEDCRYFTLPLLIGVNMNRAVKLYWRSSLIYYRNYNVAYGQGLGLSFTW